MTKRVHFSGIGGTAMVAGARLALEAGWEVRGSDTPLYPPVSTMVRALGAPTADRYDAANLDWTPDVVVIGNALSRGNPEVEAVLSRRMHYTSLPEWLKDNVLRRRRPVVVAGTHGKTTTTALTAHLLEKGGFNGGYLIGGEALGFEHSSKLGEDNSPFVIEGDEYDTAFFDKRAKFFHYLPEMAIVTSIEFDHGDIYRDLGEIETAFRRMLRQMPKEGVLFVCADNHAACLTENAYCPVESYGFASEADWRGVYRDDGSDGARLEVWRRERKWGELRSPLAGRHNLQNALAAVAVAAKLGMKAPDIEEALRSFPGVRRRMEVFLEAEGIVFVDDFAHHPTAIRETIAAAHMRWPGRPVRVVFEPRSNTMVTNKFQPELQEALTQAQEVFVGPIHRGDSIPAAERLDRESLAKSLQRQGIPVRCFDAVSDIVAALQETARAGDVVLFMSNGAFGGIYQQIRDAFGNA